MTIKSIGSKMATQNNRMTQYPMYAIQVDVKVSAPEGAANECERKDLDYYEPEDICEACLKLVAKGDDLPDQCDECESSCFWWYNIERKLEVEKTGVFFTAEACQAHINANSYHYNNPKVYGIGSWRNLEMQLVQKHLIEQAGEELPRHYK